MSGVVTDNTTQTQTRYVSTMRRLLSVAGRLVESSEHDTSARQELAAALETAVDLVCLQLRQAHQPQIAALAPPDSDDD